MSSEKYAELVNIAEKLANNVSKGKYSDLESTTCELLEAILDLMNGEDDD